MPPLAGLQRILCRLQRILPSSLDVSHLFHPHPFDFEFLIFDLEVMDLSVDFD